MTATLLQFPTHRLPPRPRTVSLLRLDGTPWASAGFLPGDPGAPWAWIQECVAAECGCNEDDVHAIEGGEESGFADLITADGIPVYRAVIGRP